MKRILSEDFPLSQFQYTRTQRYWLNKDETEKKMERKNNKQSVQFKLWNPSRCYSSPSNIFLYTYTQTHRSINTCSFLASIYRSANCGGLVNVCIYVRDSFIAFALCQADYSIRKHQWQKILQHFYFIILRS